MLNGNHATPVIAPSTFDPMVVNPIDVSIAAVSFWERHGSQRFAWVFIRIKKLYKPKVFRVGAIGVKLTTQTRDLVSR